MLCDILSFRLHLRGQLSCEYPAGGGLCNGWQWSRMRKVFAIIKQVADALVPGIRGTTPPSPVRERFAKAPVFSIQPGCQSQDPHVREEAYGAALLGSRPRGRHAKAACIQVL